MIRRKFLLLILLCLVTVSGCTKSDRDDNIRHLADLNQPQYTVGAIVGAASEPYVGEVLPNAVEKQFNALTDMTIALESGQIDAMVFTRATLESIMNERPNKFRILDEPLGETEMHTVISPQTKLPDLVDEVNEFLAAKKRDGTLQKMYDYWFVEHKTVMPPDHVERLEGTGKKLVVGAFGNTMPQSFYANNQPVGFDIETIELFAAEYGYEIEYRIEDIISLLADAEFGKIDVISGTIMYTPERAERVIFPKTPLYKLPISAMIRDTAAAGKSDNFFANLKTSFEKTLIREDRYKMLLDGLKVTLIIAGGSLVLGTILGFVLCMMKRSSVKIVAKLTTAFIALISGLPIVLTLMICFYIIFSGTGLTEIAISIIAFAIDFGCYVAIILNSGIESVAAGEIEAATAMGMSTWQIFKTITFPQAVQKIFGVYRRQVISLIKATSIVGYIAVQDLTKVSDIIRARTYDAFFSLIFTAAIYFLIARICIFLLDVADNKLNRRKKDVAE